MPYNFNITRFEATEVRDMSFTHDHASSEEHEIGSFDHATEEGNMTTFHLHAVEPQSHLPNGKMPGVRCPRCAERGIETWVLSGKHCPKCNHPC